MADRYLKIEVIKEFTSTVYVKVDDENSKFSDIFNEKGELEFPYVGLDVDDFFAAVDNLKLDWQEDDFCRPGIICEVPEEEAASGKLWDAVENCTINEGK